jgi:ABC transporter DrrB family efflux protein
MRGFWAILLKEFSHIRRERSTIVFAFLVPALQLMVFGFAIDVTIDNIPIVVLDLDQRQESRRLVDSLCNTQSFRVDRYVQSLDDLHHGLRSGRAKAGIIIPPDYTDRLLRREQATFQVLIDGSDSQVATTALNAAELLAVQLSIGRARVVAESLQTGPARDQTGDVVLPIEARPRLLYNPDLESSHFFVPGLIGTILQLVLVFLTSSAVVREREYGTLEQLFVTPVGRAGLMLGKLVPYAIMAVGELVIILLIMTEVFGVPIKGSLTLLFLLSGLFILTALGLGLLISTLATTQLQALQFSFLVLLPSVLLSGFMFPRAEMPLPLYLAGYGLPVTYFLEILRGVILRGADAVDLMPNIIGLAICCVAAISLSVARFHKQLD